MYHILAEYIYCVLCKIYNLLMELTRKYNVLHFIKFLDIELFRYDSEYICKQLERKNANTMIVNEVIELDKQWIPMQRQIDNKNRILNIITRVFRDKSYNNNNTNNEYIINKDLNDIKRTDIEQLSQAQLRLYSNHIKKLVELDKHNIHILETNIIDKINIIGNVIYDCNDFNAKRRKKHYNRPY